MEIQLADFGLPSFAYAFVWLITLIPLRLTATILHRRISLKQDVFKGSRVAYALLPTLVFGLVMAGILRERFQIARPIFGGAIIYTIVITMIPGFLLKAESILMPGRRDFEDMPPIPPEQPV
jgi:hypothetical protein